MQLILDGQNIRNRQDLYDEIRSQLPVPEYFGNNLDALHDILSEASETLQIVIHGFSGLRPALGGHYLLSLLSMLTDAGNEIHILS